jgi:hypothetical protein
MRAAPPEPVQTPTRKERRAVPRHQVRLHVALVDAQARTLADGRITDLSVCGARIENLPLEVDRLDWGGSTPLFPDVVIWLAVHTLPRLIRARVIWRQDAALGVLFQDVPPPADVRLRQLIPGQ